MLTCGVLLYLRIQYRQANSMCLDTYKYGNIIELVKGITKTHNELKITHLELQVKTLYLQTHQIYLLL